MNVSKEKYAWPITITQDRYNGSYSGGKWVAWLHYPEDIPTEPGEDDVTARIFWIEDRKSSVGLGHTPDEALADLYKKHNLTDSSLGKTWPQ